MSPESAESSSKQRTPKPSPPGTPTHLGIPVGKWGTSFEWSDEVPAGTGQTAWSIFPADSKHFGPGDQTCMINYRVDDLDALLKQLETAGVWIDPKRDDASYGKFAWDPGPRRQPRRALATSGRRSGRRQLISPLIIRRHKTTLPSIWRSQNLYLEFVVA